MNKRKIPAHTMKSKKNANDPKRLVNQKHCTTDGEIAEKAVTSLDQNQIYNEDKYDGFYAVCTNLEDNVSDIIKINQRRWEIEECFRIMKTAFKACPVYPGHRHTTLWYNNNTLPVP